MKPMAGVPLGKPLARMAMAGKADRDDEMNVWALKLAG